MVLSLSIWKLGAILSIALIAITSYGFVFHTMYMSAVSTKDVHLSLIEEVSKLRYSFNCYIIDIIIILIIEYFFFLCSFFSY
jgi:hypothetical protein